MTTRRRFVTGVVGAAATGALAGCLGPLSDAGGTDGLTLDTLAVGDSPGDSVPVAPDRVTLLDFFATWCAPCKPQMAELRAIDEGFPEVHLLSITSERDEAAVRSFWTEYEGTWPVALDPDLEAASRYEAGRVPTMIVLDADGEEQWRHSGLAAAATIADELAAAGADGGVG